MLLPILVSVLMPLSLHYTAQPLSHLPQDLCQSAFGEYFLQDSSIDLSSVSVFRVLREQWIRAKYERKEFSEPGKNFTYEEGKCARTHACMHKNTFILMGDLCWFPAGTRDGTLMKRGRDNGQFLSRRFVLSEREGTLKYFTKYDVSSSL